MLFQGLPCPLCFGHPTRSREGLQKIPSHMRGREEESGKRPSPLSSYILECVFSRDLVDALTLQELLKVSLFKPGLFNSDYLKKM